MCMTKHISTYEYYDINNEERRGTMKEYIIVDFKVNFK